MGILYDVVIASEIRSFQSDELCIESIHLWDEFYFQFPKQFINSKNIFRALKIHHQQEHVRNCGKLTLKCIGT